MEPACLNGLFVWPMDKKKMVGLCLNGVKFWNLSGYTFRQRVNMEKHKSYIAKQIVLSIGKFYFLLLETFEVFYSCELCFLVWFNFVCNIAFFVYGGVCKSITNSIRRLQNKCTQIIWIFSVMY